MKKKIKLFSTIAVLCLSVAMLVFGVFSALTISYKTKGFLTYDINDTYVEIETRVYSCEKNYTSNDLIKEVSKSYEASSFSALDQLTETGIVEGETTYAFNKVQIQNTDKEGYVPNITDYKDVYSSVTDKNPPEDLVLDISYFVETEDTPAVFTYFVITKVTNKSSLPLYAYVPTVGDDKYVAPENSYTYKLSGHKELATKDSEAYIVFAMSLQNSGVTIDEAEFVLPVVVTRDIEEVDSLFIDAQQTVYKYTTPVTTQAELINYVNSIINGTETLSQPAGLEPAPQSTQIATTSTTYEYDADTGLLASGTQTISKDDLQNNETYVVVLDIANSGIKTAYTKLSKSTSTVAGMQVYISDSYLRLLEDQSQKIVLAYNVTDATQLPQEIQIEFEVVAAETPYNYADLHETINATRGFLQGYKEDGTPKYFNKLKTLTFTNNKADIGDMSQVVDTFKVGEATAEDGTKTDMFAYFVPNGELFDVYTYAPVNVIYAPVDSYGFFSEWFYYDNDSYESGSYTIVWSYHELEYIYFNNFDVSKTKSLYAIFGGLRNVKRIYGLETWDTSNVQNFGGMFLGCSNLEEVNLSSFTFESCPDAQAVMGIVGINDAYILGAFGEEIANPIINAETQEDKIYQTALVMGEILEIYPGGGARYTAERIYQTHIAKIICPKDLRGFVTGLPQEDTQYCYQNDPQTKVDFLVDGNAVLVLSES